MNIAMIASGQPRFTKEILKLFEQLKGFNQAHLYLTFWSSDWSRDANDAAGKIEKILPSNYEIAKLQILDQPPYELPPHKKHHPSEQYPNVRWAYKRRIGMWLSTKLSFSLITDHYDIVLKFRPDGMLTNDLNIDQLDFSTNDLLFPNFPKHGAPGKEICDQFVIGTYQGLEFYSSMSDHFREYVPEVYPQWEDNIHEWASEHILSHHLEINNRVQVTGNYGHILAGTAGSLTSGRNPFTDNHYHHPIIQGVI